MSKNTEWLLEKNIVNVEETFFKSFIPSVGNKPAISGETSGSVNQKKLRPLC